jgi:hypothetical protein
MKGESPRNPVPTSHPAACHYTRTDRAISRRTHSQVAIQMVPLYVILFLILTFHKNVRITSTKCVLYSFPFAQKFRFSDPYNIKSGHYFLFHELGPLVCQEPSFDGWLVYLKASTYTGKYSTEKHGNVLIFSARFEPTTQTFESSKSVIDEFINRFIFVSLTCYTPLWILIRTLRLSCSNDNMEIWYILLFSPV